MTQESGGFVVIYEIFFLRSYSNWEMRVAIILLIDRYHGEHVRNSSDYMANSRCLYSLEYSRRLRSRNSPQGAIRSILYPDTHVLVAKCSGYGRTKAPHCCVIYECFVRDLCIRIEIQYP
jgi:hypothetical protein